MTDLYFYLARHFQGRIAWDNWARNLVMGDPPVTLESISTRFSPQVVGDGMKTVRSAARRNLGIRSWELHHEHRRDALFSRNWIRRLKSLILNGKWRVLCEVDWGRRIFQKYFGYVLGFILDLEAETLSESRSFKAHLPIWTLGADVVELMDFWAV